MLKNVSIGLAMLAMSLPVFANTQLSMKTTAGNIEIELFNDKAPISAKNFENYVKSNFYTDTVFHRVIPGFMIQGGGMDENLNEKKNNPPIKNESANGVKNTKGTLAMARTNDPDSASSQFFINLEDNDFLNRTWSNPGYAVFGRVTKGMEVVDAIAKVPTGNYKMHKNVPSKPIKIISVTIKPTSKK